MHQTILNNDNAMKNVAAEIGEDLMEVKARLKHGELAGWCGKRITFSYRKVREYMQVAKTKMAERRQFDGCTSIREVLALGKPKKTPKAELRAATLDDLRKVERLRSLQTIIRWLMMKEVRRT